MGQNATILSWLAVSLAHRIMRNRANQGCINTVEEGGTVEDNIRRLDGNRHWLKGN